MDDRQAGLSASASDNVLFPDPASPVTMTRRPSANGASLIAVSVPHVPLVDPWHIRRRVTYISGRATSRGRLGSLLENGPLRQAGHVVAAAVVIAALAMVIGAAVDIV